LVDALEYAAALRPNFALRPARKMADNCNLGAIGLLIPGVAGHANMPLDSAKIMIVRQILYTGMGDPDRR